MATRTASVGGSSRGTVLLVEDSTEMADVVSEVLQDEGFAVTVAASGNRGLEALAGGAPDVVLLDHQLPDMDGGRFASLYRATPGPHVPLVLVTAAYRPEEIAASIGADAVLSKPFNLEALLALLDRYLPETN
jgi:two-component system, OmpR family, response regulator